MQYRVIKEQSSHKRWLLWAAGLLTCCAVGGLGFLWGVSAAQIQIRENSDLRAQAKQLLIENAQLQSKLTDNELIIDTQKYTSVALRDELTTLHKSKAILETELGFFRKIMMPGATRKGLHLERFDVRTKEGSGFVLEATLIQVAERPRVVTGSVVVKIEGTRNGAPEILLSNDLANSSEKLDFRFRYFQQLEQSVELPFDFTPLRVRVAVVANKKTTVKTEYSWPA